MHKTFSSTAFALLLTLCASSVAAEDSDKSSQPESKSELKAQALKLYEKFKQLDSNSDPALLDLYSDDAVIYSGVERERGGVIFEKFRKADFKAEVERAIKNPYTVELNKKTVYTDAKVKETRHEVQEQVVEVTFKARRGESGAKVHWLLKPSPSKTEEHTLVIFDEHSTIYALKPRPLKHPHSQI